MRYSTISVRGALPAACRSSYSEVRATWRLTGACTTWVPTPRLRTSMPLSTSSWMPCRTVGRDRPSRLDRASSFSSRLPGGRVPARMASSMPPASCRYSGVALSRSRVRSSVMALLSGVTALSTAVSLGSMFRSARQRADVRVDDDRGPAGQARSRGYGPARLIVRYADGLVRSKSSPPEPVRSEPVTADPARTGQSKPAQSQLAQSKPARSDGAVLQCHLDRALTRHRPLGRLAHSATDVPVPGAGRAGREVAASDLWGASPTAAPA